MQDTEQQWQSGEVRHLRLQHLRHFVYLFSVVEGWSPPPSTVAHVSSQQTRVGSTWKDQEYLQRGCGKKAGGQVEHLVEWSGRKREL